MRIFRPKREEGAGDWRRLHDEELHNLGVSQNIIRVIKSRRIKWAGCVARIGEMEVHSKFWSGNLKGRETMLKM
jgi:hypothetical protein